jgi:hypothetical protein
MELLVILGKGKAIDVSTLGRALATTQWELSTWPFSRKKNDWPGSLKDSTGKSPLYST